MNLEIRRLGETLVKEINTSEIPLEAKRLVVSEILAKLEAETNKAILLEVEMVKKTEKETESEDVDG